MPPLFLLQVIASFVVGGVVITAMTLAAERWYRFGGLIYSFPSTVVVSFVFIALGRGPAAICDVAGAVPLALVATVAFMCVFIPIAKAVRPRGSAVLVASAAAWLGWFALAVPSVYAKDLPLAVAATIFLVTLTAGALILRRLAPVEVAAGAPPRYNLGQKGLRAAFAGAVVAAAVVLAKVGNEFWAGVAAVAPAAIASSLAILRWYRSGAVVAATAKSAPVGLFLIFLFALAARWFYPALGIVAGTGACLGVCVVAAAVVLLVKPLRALVIGM